MGCILGHVVSERDRLLLRLVNILRHRILLSQVNERKAQLRLAAKRAEKGTMAEPGLRRTPSLGLRPQRLRELDADAAKADQHSRPPIDPVEHCATLRRFNIPMATHGQSFEPIVFEHRRQLTHQAKILNG